MEMVCEGGLTAVIDGRMSHDHHKTCPVLQRGDMKDTSSRFVHDVYILRCYTFVMKFIFYKKCEKSSIV